MTTLTLTRLASMPFGVFGQLGDLVTLERPWKDNAPGISCIPAGTYTAVRRMSPRFGRELFMLQDVPGRDYVELHAGNLPGDTEGCLILGSRYGCLGGEWCVLDSQAALKRFMALLEGQEEFTLTVEWWRA